jgi:threonine/homoserine/homoserine lactone efflux protein
MMDLWPVLMPLLLADMVNPVLFGFMVYAAGTKSPVAAGTAAVLGHTLAYFCVGLVLAPGIEFVEKRLAAPHSIDFAIGMCVGLLLLWAAIVSFKKKEIPRIKEYEDLSCFKAFGLGAVVNFLGVPFALPYFAALGQILKADLLPLDAVVVLVGYNFVYALPFLLVPLLVVALGDASTSLIKRISTWVEEVSSYLMPVILTLVGVALVMDGLLFFVTQQGLF